MNAVQLLHSKILKKKKEETSDKLAIANTGTLHFKCYGQSALRCLFHRMEFINIMASAFHCSKQGLLD